MNRWPQRDGKPYLCCAFLGPQGHEGSLNMSVDLQSRSRGSPLRVVLYFQRLMDGRRATGIAMDYCEVGSHSFHVASDKVRVGSKSNDDAHLGVGGGRILHCTEGHRNGLRSSQARCEDPSLLEGARVSGGESTVPRLVVHTTSHSLLVVDSMVNMLEITPALLRHCLHDHGVPWEFKLEQSRNVFAAGKHACDMVWVDEWRGDFVCVSSRPRGSEMTWLRERQDTFSIKYLLVKTTRCQDFGLLVVDISVAFMHARTDEEIYVKVRSGIKSSRVQDFVDSRQQ